MATHSNYSATYMNSGDESEVRLGQVPTRGKIGFYYKPRFKGQITQKSNARRSGGGGDTGMKWSNKALHTKQRIGHSYKRKT